MIKDCNKCGEPINPNRLRANPTCVYCIRCQEWMEENGEFVRHSIEIHQEISGWDYRGERQTLIKGTET